MSSIVNGKLNGSGTTTEKVACLTLGQCGVPVNATLVRELSVQLCI